MRNILIITFLLTQHDLLSQDKPLIFQNFGTPEVIGRDSFYSQKIHEVALNPDKTYEFWSRPFVSCLTWRQYKGTWQQHGDTLLFADSYVVNEQDTRVTYHKDLRRYFFIHIKTDRNSALKNRTVMLRYIYDFEAGLDEIEKIFTLGPGDKIQIPFKDIPHFGHLSAIKIKYQINSKEERSDYLTQNNPLNVKKSSIPNIINVEFVEKPRKEKVHRITTAVLKNDILYILSTRKTKTKLPDYHGDIEFENNFVLRR